MKNLIYLTANTVSHYMTFLMVFTFFRMFMSLFAVSETPTKAEHFVCSVTEPIVFPIRYILGKSEMFQSIPIDFSLVITLMLLLTIKMFV